MELAILLLVLAALVAVILRTTTVVVPQQNAYVVERLGRFHEALGAGLHVMMPFLDKVRYKYVLKEEAWEIPEQICITRDNVQVKVDGILFSKVMDPQRAAYGITNYRYAINQLAQTRFS